MPSDELIDTIANEMKDYQVVGGEGGEEAAARCREGHERERLRCLERNEGKRARREEEGAEKDIQVSA